MDHKNNLVLIGMPGAGKSSTGVVVAKILGMDFVDTDLLIQARYNKMLWELIEEHGPEGYIALEGDTLLSVKRQHCVIATGGSAIYSDAAMQHLRSIGTVVYLRTSLESLEERLGDLDERGVVMREGTQGNLAALYEQRAPLYERYADITVDTTGLSVHEAPLAIVKAVS